MTNTLKTSVLLAGLAGLMMAIGSLFGQGGLIIGFVLAIVTVGGSYCSSDRRALRSARAAPVSEAEMPQYYAVVREPPERAGMPMPRLYVTPNAQPNAFAT